MKKIILFLLFAWVLLNTSLVIAQTQSDCIEGISNLLWENNPLCGEWKTSVAKKCSNAWGIFEWNELDCQCTLFFWAQLQNTQSCESVPTAEELELAVNNCEWWELLKDWSCCLWTPYDKATIWNDYKKCCNGTPYDDDKKCCEQGIWIWRSEWDICLWCSTEYAKILPGYQTQCSEDTSNCATGHVYQSTGWLTKCCPWMVVDSQENPGTKACIVNTEWTAGMTINSGCLINGQCKYNIYETLWIRKSDQNPSVGSFVKDIVLAVTTFIGTVVAIVLIVSGVLYIMAWIKWDTSMADKAKKWIFNSVVWLVLVVTSYAIVRLIQFLATAGWW